MRGAMLISSSNKLSGVALLLLGVASSVVSLFVFAAGWESSSVILLLVGAAAAALSLFTFAMGWDKLKTYRDSGRVQGRLLFPDLGYPLTFHPTIYLSNIDGSDRTLVPNNVDGTFALVRVMPGEYLLSVEGYGLSTVTKPATALSGQSTNLGEIRLEFAPAQFWRTEELPRPPLPNSRHIMRIGPGPNGSVWAVGFCTDRNHHNEYEVFRRQGSPPEWRAVVIPQFNKRAERAAATRLFSDGTFLIGSFRAGAVISQDGGLSWEALDIPEVDMVSEVVELADGTWLLVARRYLLKSFDKSLTWHLVAEMEEEVSSVLQASTGRLLIGTRTIHGTTEILFSNDLGDTWEKAEIRRPKKLRGIQHISQ